MTNPTPAPERTTPLIKWRYEICYGPDGEDNYAFVHDANGICVANMRTHHAIMIVNAMNAPTDEVLRLREAQAALCKIGAECHKRKWQFDPDGPPAREVRNQLKKAIKELEAIGDMAITAYRAALTTHQEKVG